MQWYKTGTVTVTNGSDIVTGISSDFITYGKINQGDTFTIDGNIFYEIKFINSETEIQLYNNYNETTQSGIEYAIIRSGTENLSNAQLASLVVDDLTQKLNFIKEVNEWKGGTVDGGPNSDGDYPLTDAKGVTTLVPCPAKIADLAGGSEAAKGYAEEWANKAVDVLVSIEAGGDGVDDYSALHHATKSAISAGAASTSETNAGISETNAASSAGAASISETNAGISETAAGISETNAGTSETNAGTSETNASNSAAMAHDWAEEAEDVEVSAGEYSAHHWAIKAENFGNISDLDVLNKIKNVDGSGSGLDADLLDGNDSTYFAPQSITYTKTETDAVIANLVDSAPETLDTLNELAAALGDDPDFATTISTQLGNKLDSSTYTAADVLSKIKTVDGTGSGLDADTLDGYDSSTFLAAAGKTEWEVTQTSHGFSVLDVIYSNTGTWVKAKADNPETLGLGIVTEVVDGNTFKASLSGYYEATSHGLTVDEFYYLSDTVAGGLTSTEPDNSQPVLYVVDSGNVLILPYRPSSIPVQGFTEITNAVGTATTTVVNVSYTLDALLVFCNGIQLGDDSSADVYYTATNGTSITITGTIVDDAINIITFGDFEVADAYTKTQSDGNIASALATDSSYYTYGGSANAITLTSLDTALTALTIGQQYRFRATAANTGSTTINVDGIGVKTCKTITGIDLPAGYIRTDVDTVCTYDGTNLICGREEEYGSNSNGAFWKSADGRLTCSIVDMATEDATDTLDGLYRTSLLSWTFPALFIVVPVFNGGQSSENGQWVAKSVAISKTSVNFVIWNAVTNSNNIFISLAATGRWY